MPQMSYDASQTRKVEIPTALLFWQFLVNGYC